MQAVYLARQRKMTEMEKEKLDLKCSKNYSLAKFISAREFARVEKLMEMLVFRFR